MRLSICGNLSEHCSEDSYSRVKSDQTHVVLLVPLLVADGFSFVSLRQIYMYNIYISFSITSWKPRLLFLNPQKSLKK